VIVIVTFDTDTVVVPLSARVNWTWSIFIYEHISLALITSITIIVTTDTAWKFLITFFTVEWLIWSKFRSKEDILMFVTTTSTIWFERDLILTGEASIDITRVTEIEWFITFGTHSIIIKEFILDTVSTFLIIFG